MSILDNGVEFELIGGKYIAFDIDSITTISVRDEQTSFITVTGDPEAYHVKGSYVEVIRRLRETKQINAIAHAGSRP